MSQVFACDWPDGGKTCGKPAEWYLPGASADRPICTGCLAKVTPQPANHYSIEHIDPSRVPGPTFKAPPDPWGATRLGGGGGVGVKDGATGIGGGIPFKPSTWLDDEAAAWNAKRPRVEPIPPAPAAPSRPPLKEACADLAAALLSLGLEKITEWRKR